VISQSKIKNYKELRFWQTAFEVTTSVNEKALWIISDQVIRASSSVGANIAEGFGRYKGKEFERFLQISFGSANEVEYWLLVLKKAVPRFSGKIDLIIGRNSETIKILASSLKSLRIRNKN